jgi:hypothetical protein
MELNEVALQSRLEFFSLKSKLLFLVIKTEIDKRNVIVTDGVARILVKIPGGHFILFYFFFFLFFWCAPFGFLYFHYFHCCKS